MTNQSVTREAPIQRQIILAAQQLFRLYGLQKVTMDDVAREIGKGRSSLYYYYKSKEELLDAAIDIEMREILADLSAAADKASGFEEKLSAYCMTRLKRSEKRKAFYSTLDEHIQTAGEMSEYMKMRETIHLRFRELEIPLIKSILQHGVKEGKLRKLTTKEQDTLAFLLLSALQGFKKEINLKNSYQGIAPAIELFTGMVLQGFRP